MSGDECDVIGKQLSMRFDAQVCNWAYADVQRVVCQPNLQCLVAAAAAAEMLRWITLAETSIFKTAQLFRFFSIRAEIAF